MARRDVFVVGAITLAGALLRFTTLDVQSFWLDEGLTALRVEASFGTMLELENESTPPLYFVLAWLWAYPFGSGEIGLRSLSAFLGTATIPVAYLVARRIGGFRVGWVTAAIVATNPLLIWYSQEARSYALLVLLGALSLLFFLRLLERHDRLDEIGWAMTSGLALATHYFAIYLVGLELLLLLVQAYRRGRVMRLLPAFAAVVAVGAALLPLLLHQLDTTNPSWIAEGIAGDLPIRLVRIPGEFLTGHHPPGHLPLAVLSAGLAFASVALLLRHRARRARSAAAVPSAIGALVVLLPSMLAVAGVDYILTRNVILAVLPLVVVVALGAVGSGAGRWAIALPGGICVLGVVAAIGIAADGGYQRDDWRGAAHALDDLGADGRPRVVGVAADNTAALLVYLPEARQLYGTARVSEVDLLLLAQRESLEPLRAPDPSPRASPVPGFRPFASVQGETFTIIRYRSPSPRRVSGLALRREQIDGQAVDPVLLP